MTIITEYKNGNDSYYEISTMSESGAVYKSYIHPRAVIVPRKGRDYYLLYNSNMEVLHDAFDYINRFLQGKATNTLIRAHSAMKFLAAFEEIIGKSLEKFTYQDITSLKYFLHGYSPKGQIYELNLITTRTNDTVNGYLSVYRSYLKFKEINEHPLFNTTERIKKISPGFREKNTRGVNYSSNERAYTKPVEVPKYISVDEFVRILEYVRARYDIMTEIIIRLMFQCGLRIGEVLGLTAEDLVMENVERLPRRDAYRFKDRYIPIAYLRNRVSDSKDQRAKGCMKVVSRKQYETADYKLYNNGFQFVVVPQDLFDLINEYIEDKHIKARELSRDRYYKKTIADRVEKGNEYDDDNYYVFINSIGTPISASSWNDRMRDIYKATGIEVDRNRRKNNLNHRFRHGYAMFNIQYCHVEPTILADLLRHGSLESVMCYYNPTISDQIKLKNAFVEDMYERIPELRRTYNNE